jgi:hypothetical protein
MNADIHAKTQHGATPLLVACQTLQESKPNQKDEADDVAHINLLLSFGASAQDKANSMHICVVLTANRITMDGVVCMQPLRFTMFQ